MSAKKKPRSADKQALKQATRAAKHPEAAAYKKLRERAQDGLEHRLRTYYETAAADAGLQSCMASLYSAGGGSGSPDARMTERRLNAMLEHRCVAAALTRLTPQQQNILHHAYGDERWPLDVYGPDQYGDTPGVALLTEAAAKHYRRELDKRTEAAEDAEAKAPVERVNQPERSRLERAVDIRFDDDRLCPLRPNGAAAKARAALHSFQDRGIGAWLRSGKSKDHRPAIREEADALLREARAAFLLVQGPARDEILSQRRGWSRTEARREREAAAEPKRRKGRAPRPEVQGAPLGAFHLGGL